MKWILPSGRIINRNDSVYRVIWDKPSKSKEQFLLKQFLKKYWFNHILFEEILLPSTLLRVDFLSATKKIAIEHQGVGHVAYNSFIHRNSRFNYLGSIKRDVKKREYLERNGYLLIETFTEDLKELSPHWFKTKYNIDL